MAANEIKLGPLGWTFSNVNCHVDGAAVPLRSRALDILIALAQAKSDLVTKDQLD